MQSMGKSSFAVAICVAVAATAFASEAAAGPINVVSPLVVKTPSVTEQIYYRRVYRGYYRRGYGYGYGPRRYYYGRPYGYGYGYGYGYPVLPVPIPLPGFGW